MIANDNADAVEKCEENARKLIDSARLLVEHDGSTSAAYHLAILAIEEIGKACLLKIGQVNFLLGREFALERRLDDHSQKLFWAFFLPGFSTSGLTPADIEQARALAHNMHEKRLASLYVSHTDDDLLLEISKDEATQTIQLADARLRMEAAFSATPDEQKLDDLKWLMDAVGDERRRPTVFSGQSMKRLQANGDVGAWIAWLRAQFAEQEKAMQAVFDKEMQRQPPTEENELKEKWKIRIRLTFTSHSIRQKVFNTWNEHVLFTRFFEGNKKRRELVLELRLPYTVPLARLWDTVYSLTNRALLAFNIGALGGFCWWYDLNREHVFYDELVDLENDANVRLEINNKYLHVDWGQRALSKDDVQRAMLVHAFLPKPDASAEERKPFDKYLTALAFLAKTDLHLNLTPNACDCFFQSLVTAMKFYGDMRDDESFGSAFERNLGSIFSDPAERQSFVDLAASLERAEQERGFGSLTFDKVLQTKVLCDAYILRKFGQLADERVAREVGEGSRAD